MTHPSEAQTELIPAMREPEPQVPRGTALMIWGAMILLASIVLAIAVSWFISAAYIQHNDERWCSYFATMTAVIPAGGAHVLYTELRTAQREAGCT